MCDVPKMLGHTDTGTFFRHRFRYHKKKRKILVPVPIINLQNSEILATKISSGTHFFPIPVPILFSGYKIFQDFFPEASFSDTGSNTTKKLQIHGTGTSHSLTWNTFNTCVLTILVIGWKYCLNLIFALYQCIVIFCRVFCNMCQSVSINLNRP